MPKMSLLEIVQKTLASMDSDDVNSIDDTEESLQVADIAEDTYFELLTQGEWPHLNQLCQLESVGDSTRPTNLRLPDTVDKIDTIRYERVADSENPREFLKVTWKDPDTFVADSYALTIANSDVQETFQDGVSVFIQNDRQPDFWTSFDDEHIVFSSFDNTVESTLQGSKTTTRCKVIPVWTTSDAFIPDLPAKMFPLFLAEVKSASHQYLKQQASPTDSKRSVRGFNRIRQENGRANEYKNRPRFGRR